jgi:hypothetical protein
MKIKKIYRENKKLLKYLVMVKNCKGWKPSETGKGYFATIFNDGSVRKIGNGVLEVEGDLIRVSDLNREDIDRLISHVKTQLGTRNTPAQKVKEINHYEKFSFPTKSGSIINIKLKWSEVGG